MSDNGWAAYGEHLRLNGENRDLERNRPPVDCPNDGTPLDQIGNRRHCPHDGWTWPEKRIL